MSINLIETWDIDLVLVKIKFEPTVKVSTIINERFSLFTDEATPILVSSDPFDQIVVAEDYDSIGKILTLRWNADLLEENTSYKIEFSGFRTVSGQLIDDDYVSFSVGADATPGYSLTEPDPVEIIDYTLIPDAFTITSSSDEPADEGFAFVESDPLNDDAFLPEDYNNGVVVLKFNAIPNEALITSSYIIVQRKPIQRKPSRWESVLVEFELHDTEPWVYVKFPSNDATPVYDTADAVYFEENFKYRIKVLKDFGG